MIAQNLDPGNKLNEKASKLKYNSDSGLMTIKTAQNGNTGAIEYGILLAVCVCVTTCWVGLWSIKSNANDFAADFKIDN